MKFSNDVSAGELGACLSASSLTTTFERLIIGRLAACVKPPQVIVEIGAWDGGTTRTLRHFAPDTEIMSVDIAPKDKAFRVARECNINLIIGDSAKSAVKCDKEVGFLFIDGDHSIEGALADWNAWSPKCKSGAHVVFHDYQPVWPGVLCVADALVRTGKVSNAEVVDQILWGEIMDSTPPTSDDIIEVMDDIVARYLQAAEAITSLPAGISDATANLLDALSRCGKIPLWIVGKGKLGMEAAARLRVGYDRCIDSSSAKDVDALYVIAGTPEYEIVSTLTANGISNQNIVSLSAMEMHYSLFGGGRPIPVFSEGSLSAIFESKFRKAFSGKEGILFRSVLLSRERRFVPTFLDLF